MNSQDQSLDAACDTSENLDIWNTLREKSEEELTQTLQINQATTTKFVRVICIASSISLFVGSIGCVILAAKFSDIQLLLCEIAFILSGTLLLALSEALKLLSNIKSLLVLQRDHNTNLRTNS
ncbi:MAG: hypothetical protein CBC98_07660 [Planctomycetaceae bacterium TMED138]|nr:MAG: hypothetical protein CBC98_07660 [Planctomycetaceae bacterium TMED138]